MRCQHQFATVLLTTLIFLAYGTSAPGDLVGYWSFDDESADDLSGNSNDGVINGVEFSDDIPNDSGHSVEIFGGTSIQVPHSDSLDVNDAMTVAYWIKADNDLQSANWNGPISKSGGDPRLGWEFQRFDDQSRLDIRVDTDAGENAVRGNVIGTYDDEWVHVAWTLDEGEVISYLDGELMEIGSYPHGDGFSNPDVDLLIGCRGNNWCAFDGLIDEFGIWDHVLSEDEIAALAAGESPIVPPTTIPGDYNEDGMVDAADADEQTAAMNSAAPDLMKFDENNDAVVNIADRLIWVHDHAGTWVGDSNLDGEFNSSDFVFVFSAGKYETGEAAGWADGDWNGDTLFNTSDFVAAFSDGGYEQGARPAAVPEPTTLVLAMLGLIGLAVNRRRGEQRV